MHTYIYKVTKNSVNVGHQIVHMFPGQLGNCKFHTLIYVVRDVSV